MVSIPDSAGTGLQIGGGGEGGSTSFLTSADAERLESRSKKVQLQQSYAKQLSEDATVSSAGTSRNHISGAPVSGSMPGSRRGSSEGQYGAVDSRGTGRPSSGTGSGTGRGIFESMSEKDQIAAAAAKKKASQVEYFQQLQEADRKRSDPIKSSRVALNRRDQREEEGAGRGHDSSRHSSRPSSDYSQRDQNEYSGYGSSQSRHAPVGDLISARRRQQEDYARALREDAQAAPIADSYTAKRRSHHDIENYGGRGGGSGAYTSGKVQGSNYEREEKEYEPLRQGREQVREHERYQSREEERYHERPFDRYQEREPEGHREYDKDRYQQREREQDRHQDRVVSGSDPYSVPPNPYVPSYGYVEQGGTGSSRRGSRGDLQLRREETYCDTSSSGEYEPRRAEQYSPQPDRTRSRRESEEIKRQYLFGSDADGRDRQGGAGAGAGSIPDSSYSASKSYVPCVLLSVLSCLVLSRTASLCNCGNGLWQWIQPVATLDAKSYHILSNQTSNCNGADRGCVSRHPLLHCKSY